ncbi:MAG TPA: hypothetical protein VL201_04300, partial [Patescibacteria group bacterium]|nr:hypothetical protein [Patescibacteria group bacterium]
MNLYHVSSQKKEKTLEHFLPFFQYFPSYHRTLYGSIQKIIRMNKKGVPFDIAVFKIFVRNICLRRSEFGPSVFKNELFRYYVANFFDHYLKEDSTTQETLCHNKNFLKQYIFTFFDHYRSFTYDELFLTDEKSRFEKFMEPKGFLEVNTCKTAAEEVYKNEFFKKIYF